MTESESSEKRLTKRFAANSAIVLSFIVGLEIVIMISPFAVFFYAVFNPFLLILDRSSTTRWLTAFFLPHMVVPPNGALTVVRILGSIFFVGGVCLFLVCAVQVYAGKWLKIGIATKWIYTLIRHPQYLGLAVAALGLAIMWPRFLTLVLLVVMLFLYYLLARDEERRMIGRFGESYCAYMSRTGMFFPRFIEKNLIRKGKSEHPPSIGKIAAVFLILLIATIGGGFVLRAYTVHHLPLAQISNVDVITITTEDLEKARQLLPSVLEDSVVASKLRLIPGGDGHRLLAYFIPIDYMMQGMIADTGKEWKLFEQHKTFGMITEYIFHPFAHLTGGHAHHIATQTHDPSMHNSPAMKRRIIFIEVSADGRALTSPIEDFGINIKRTPHFFADVHIPYRRGSPGARYIHREWMGCGTDADILAKTTIGQTAHHGTVPPFRSKLRT